MASSASSPTSTVSKLARRQRSGQRRDVLGERPVLGRLLARAVQILPCQRREAVAEQEARSLRHAPPRAQRHDRLGLEFGPLVCLARKTAWRFIERSASADRGLRRVAARRHTLEHRATRRRSACHTVLLHDLVQVAEMQVLAAPSLLGGSDGGQPEARADLAEVGQLQAPHTHTCGSERPEIAALAATWAANAAACCATALARQCTSEASTKTWPACSAMTW